MSKLLKVYIILTFILLGCNKENFFKGKNSIYEDFEAVNDIDELLDNGNWKYFQQTEINNYIKIDTLNPHSGSNCLKIFATKGSISKSDIANNKMAFWKDDIVQISAWFYIMGTENLNYVFLLDIEEDAMIGASPGIRIAIDADNYLLIERKKYGQSTIHQSINNKISFPRNQWVELKVEINLQQKENGYIKLWQNNIQLVKANNIQTLPKDNLFLTQGTKGMYQSVQVGVTATTSENDVTMFIDDINIKVIN